MYFTVSPSLLYEVMLLSWIITFRTKSFTVELRKFDPSLKHHNTRPPFPNIENNSIIFDDRSRKNLL
jgi:hypothetical protein